ncbi:MAG: hypothetical protein ACYS9X_33020 [Planctomycetota bacterium]
MVERRLAEAHGLIAIADSASIEGVYVVNESLPLPASCDGSIRLQYAAVRLLPGTGLTDAHGTPNAPDAELYARLLDGTVRRMSGESRKLNRECRIWPSNQKTLVKTCLASRDGGGVARTSMHVSLEYCFNFADSEGGLVGGHWSGKTTFALPVAYRFVGFAPLHGRGPGTEQRRRN